MATKPAAGGEVCFDLDASAFSNDEFRVYQFKVKRCPRARPHDWTQCPFAHPGEKAKRRDPRRFQYSGSACPEYRRNGSCRRGDACPFAHGVFECWLHPSRYRTQMCTDGTACKRRVCFFAHTESELRKPDDDPVWLQQQLQAELVAEQQVQHQMQALKMFSSSSPEGVAVSQELPKNTLASIATLLGLNMPGVQQQQQQADQQQQQPFEDRVKQLAQQLSSGGPGAANNAGALQLLEAMEKQAQLAQQAALPAAQQDAASLGVQQLRLQLAQLLMAQQQPQQQQQQQALQDPLQALLPKMQQLKPASAAAQPAATAAIDVQSLLSALTQQQQQQEAAAPQSAALQQQQIAAVLQQAGLLPAAPAMQEQLQQQQAAVTAAGASVAAAPALPDNVGLLMSLLRSSSQAAPEAAAPEPTPLTGVLLSLAELLQQQQQQQPGTLLGVPAGLQPRATPAAGPAAASPGPSPPVSSNLGALQGMLGQMSLRSGSGVPDQVLQGLASMEQQQQQQAPQQQQQPAAPDVPEQLPPLPRKPTDEQSAVPELDAAAVEQLAQQQLQHQHQAAMAALLGQQQQQQQQVLQQQAAAVAAMLGQQQQQQQQQQPPAPQPQPQAPPQQQQQQQQQMTAMQQQAAAVAAMLGLEQSNEEGKALASLLAGIAGKPGMLQNARMLLESLQMLEGSASAATAAAGTSAAQPQQAGTGTGGAAAGSAAWPGAEDAGGFGEDCIPAHQRTCSFDQILSQLPRSLSDIASLVQEQGAAEGVMPGAAGIGAGGEIGHLEGSDLLG